MPLSPGEQEKWDEVVVGIGQLSGADITSGPSRIPLGCSPEAAQELVPRTLFDLISLTEEQHALGRLTENDFIVALGFIGNLYLSTNADADVVELPLVHDVDDSYIELRFRRSEEGLDF